MRYEKYIEFINRYSYERYENFDNLDDSTKVHPVITPIDSEVLWTLDVQLLKETYLGDTFPIIQNTRIFKNIKEFISILSYYTVAILRCEPQNPYFYHCAVPSAKGIHPCECYFLVKINGKVRLLRFNSAKGTIEMLKSENEKGLVNRYIGKEMDDNDVIIIVVSDMFRLAKYYGSFSYILSALDAGHIASQMGIIASRGAEKVTTYYDINIKEIADYLEVDYNEIHPEFIMHVKLFNNLDMKELDAKKSFLKPRKSIYKNQMNEFKQIINMNNLLVEDFETKEQAGKSLSYFIIDNIKNKESFHKISSGLNKAIYNRTSAQNELGTFSLIKSIPKERFDVIMNEITTYMKNINLINNIEVYCFLNSVEGYRRGWYLLKEDGISYVKSDEECDMINFLHDSHEFLSISTMPIAIFFSCDIKKYYNEYQLNGIKTLYINTAEVCQAIEIAFSEYNYFARPLKNLNERYVEEKLELKEDKRVTYMLVIGKSNTSSLDLEVI